MDGSKVLIIDDDEKLAEALRDYLNKYNYQVHCSHHPKDGLLALHSFAPHIIILDIMMPDIDGLSLCQEIRHQSDVPIIFLSARGDTTDRIVGLELGADDYMPKPFEPRELIARIESILRRHRPTIAFTGNNLEINEEAMTVNLKGVPLELTAAEFQALNYLYKNRSKIVSRDELLTFLQGMDSEVFGRAIDILISRLRQKLKDDPKEPQFIKTIRGMGYRYVGDTL